MAKQLMPKHQYAVCTGNPFDGMFLWGPFATAEEASQWAQDLTVEWHVVRLHAPDPTENADA